MGLIDAKISESIRRTLNLYDGEPFEPSLLPYYRELIMKKLKVHHTLTKLVNRVNGEHRFHVDANAYSDNERGRPNGFFRHADSERTKRQTIRALAEAMNLGTIYVDGAGRNHLYFSHKDYSSMLGVLFNGAW
jgi:hypothetical protein